MAHHKSDVLEIRREGLSQQSLYVLNQYNLRLQSSDRGNGIREQVPFILIAPVFSAKRPRLTGNPGSQEIDVFAKGSKINGTHIAMNEGPFCNRL